MSVLAMLRLLGEVGFQARGRQTVGEAESMQAQFDLRRKEVERISPAVLGALIARVKSAEKNEAMNPHH